MASPRISGVSPSPLPSNTAVSVTITGTDLAGATAVWFGGTRVTSGISSSSNQITVTSPKITSISVTVSVTTPNGSSNSMSISVSSTAGGGGTTPGGGSGGTTGDGVATTPLPTPSISSINPSSIPADIVTQMTITGSNFGAVDGPNYSLGEVLFAALSGDAAGGALVRGTFIRYTNNSIVVNSPRLDPGSYSVSVKICRYKTRCPESDAKYSSGRTITVTAPQTPTPTISYVNPGRSDNPIRPNIGSVAGIAGYNLRDVNSVKFGSQSATIDAGTRRDDYIQVNVPSLQAGQVTVTVTTSANKTASWTAMVADPAVREIPLTISTNVDATIYFDNTVIGTGQSKTVQVKLDDTTHPIKVSAVANPSVYRDSSYRGIRGSPSTSASMYLPLVMPVSNPTVDKISRVDLSDTKVSAKTDTTIVLSFTFSNGASLPASSVGQIPPYTIKFGGGTSSLYQREISGRISGVNQVTVTVPAAVAKGLAEATDKSRYDPNLQGYPSVAWISVSDTTIYSRSGISIVDLQPISTDPTPTTSQKFDFPESYVYPGKVPRSGGTISIQVKVKSAKAGRARIKAYGQEVKSASVAGSNAVDTITIEIPVPPASGTELKTTATITAEEET